MIISHYTLSEDEGKRILRWVQYLNAEGQADLEDLELAEAIAKWSKCELTQSMKDDLESMRHAPPAMPTPKSDLIPMFSDPATATETNNLGNQPPTIKDIAHSISLQYRYEGWFQSVGLAEPDEIVIYLVKKPINYEKWQEHLRILCNPFKVRFETIGKVRPADSSPPEWVP